MAFTTYANQKILNAFGQAASLGAPATLYVGLLCVPNPSGVWTASTSYASGTYVIPTTFDSISGEQGKIFKSGGGTSGSSQPTWPTSEGGTVTDNTITWTECSSLFQAGTFTGLEPSGNGYARIAVTANSTNFPNASSAEPSVIQNGAAIGNWAPTADWGFAVGWIISDAATAGNIWQWGAMNTHLDCASGSTPSFAASALQIQLSALLTA